MNLPSGQISIPNLSVEPKFYTDSESLTIQHDTTFKSNDPVLVTFIPTTDLPQT